MLTCVAYSASISAGGVLTNISAVADQTAQTTGNFVYVPTLTPFMVGGVAFGSAKGTGTSATRFEVISPSIRQLAPVQMPVAADTIPADLVGTFLFPTTPIKLVPYEGLELKIDGNPSAGAQATGIVFLADGALAPVTGEVFTTRATGSITATTGSWVSGTLTFDDSLPEGTYQIVGLRLEGTNLVAGRLILPGSPVRPAVMAVTDNTKRDNPLFRYGAMGVLGTFDPRVAPQLEIISSGANTSQKLYLDLIKTA